MKEHIKKLLSDQEYLLAIMTAKEDHDCENIMDEIVEYLKCNMIPCIESFDEPEIQILNELPEKQRKKLTDYLRQSFVLCGWYGDLVELSEYQGIDISEKEYIELSKYWICYYETNNYFSDDILSVNKELPIKIQKKNLLRVFTHALKRGDSSVILVLISEIKKQSLQNSAIDVFEKDMLQRCKSK